MLGNEPCTIPAAAHLPRGGRIETRIRVLREGARLFAARGLAGTRAVDIAQAAGVAVGTLYLHFTDKEGLLGEVLREGLADLRGEIERGESCQAGSLEDVRGYAEAVVRFAVEHPAHARLLFGHEVAGSGVWVAVCDLLADEQEKRLRAAGAAGRLRIDVDPAVAAQALAGMLLRVLGWWTRDPGVASRAVVVDTLTKLQLAALAS